MLDKFTTVVRNSCFSSRANSLGSTGGNNGLSCPVSRGSNTNPNEMISGSSSAVLKYWIAACTLTILCVCVELVMIQESKGPPDRQLDIAYVDDLLRESASAPRIAVDLLSIGSDERSDQWEAQRDTMGRHPSVRYFHHMSEHNDTEVQCHEQLTDEAAVAIAKACRWKEYQDDSSDNNFGYLATMRDAYMPPRELKKKNSPSGWMCAQKRPIDGLLRVLRRYDATTTNDAGTALPDYLIVMDDDTYMNVDRVVGHLQETYPSETPYAVAGCLMTTDFDGAIQTFSYGGFGTILTKAALINLMRPVYCEKKKKDAFERNFCKRVSQGGVGEKELFEEGSSVADLMEAATFANAYLDYESWNEVGFCLHSDTALAYWLNYYNIAIERDADSRIHSYKESEWSYMKRDRHHYESLHQCANEEDKNCNPASEICHYVTSKHMHKLHQTIHSSKKAEKKAEVPVAVRAAAAVQDTATRLRGAEE